jgi:integrase
MAEKRSKSYFQVKKPGQGKRRSFAISALQANGSWLTLDLPELTKINEFYQSGLLPFDQAEKQVEHLLTGLYAERDKNLPKFRSDNDMLVKKFWAEKYETRPIISKESAKDDYNRIPKVLGPHLSILTSSQVDLQNHLNKEYGHAPRVHRRLVKDLNTLLSYAGRPFKLWGAKGGRERICYLTLEELLKVLPHIKVKSRDLPIEDSSRAFRLFVAAGFATGGRTGELLSIAASDLHSTWVFIQEQLRREKVKSQTKTGKVRRSVFVPELEKQLRAFISLPDSIKVWLRGSKNARFLAEACRLAGLPPEKQITFHELRHSYCMHLLSKGVQPHAIADSIGDLLTTFLQFYKDHIIEENVLNQAAAALRKRNPSKRAQ